MAALRGHEAITRLLLQAVAESVGQKDYLSVLADGGIMVKALVGDTFQLNDVDAQGRSALMLASTGTWRYVDRLLSRGADPNIIDKQGRSALHHAAATGSVKAIRRLLEEGLDPNSPDKDGWTALHWAARGGKIANAKILLEAGADLMAKAADGWTSFTVAAYHGRVSLMEILRPSSESLEAFQTRESRQALSERIVSQHSIEPRTEASETELLPAACDGCELVGVHFTSSIQALLSIPPRTSTVPSTNAQCVPTSIIVLNVSQPPT